MKKEYYIKPKDDKELHMYEVKIAPVQQEWINRCEKMMAQIIEKGMRSEPFKKEDKKMKILNNEASMEEVGFFLDNLLTKAEYRKDFKKSELFKDRTIKVQKEIFIAFVLEDINYTARVVKSNFKDKSGVLIRTNDKNIYYSTCEKDINFVYNKLKGC